ncbi:dTDP-4-amino-4,6-dideoxygalactose transaminase [Evansella caseinilytica]|uniref:dTDP-4-amino-4,6-dideoxygalactose transaminase n=1 Tax=Evansella caseinilytica TaxID=1503961 RepID=A0A1H3HMR9_9BACI|nr:DegT/DnrJ/EryC1/StrS family aminotransferase [Evansella caseinilytica]SDY16826.1 dTDP-4-amino-4,6-dideoxygalactose transaminase [Evansella caseinilytica]
MTAVPLMNIRAQYEALERELLSAAKRVLSSGKYINGEEGRQFEKELAAFTNTRYAVSTANGTDALILALHACGVGRGDEVITSPFTFFASAEAIARVGATPVFADIDDKTFNLDPEKTAEKITVKTKAIIPVHLFGQPAEMDAFLALARKHHLYVIEDACQALGAEYKAQPAGGIADAGCFSFFPTKNLGGFGDGGMVVTNNPEVAEKVRLLALHGSRKKYFHETIGYNSRLDEIQAAVLRIKLKYITEWNNRRREKAAIYSEELQGLDLNLPAELPHVRHVYHLFVLQSKKRQGLGKFLQKKGIATGHYYPRPLHLQTAFASLGYQEGDLPVAEAASQCSLALPLFPELAEADQMKVIQAIREFHSQ